MGAFHETPYKIFSQIDNDHPSLNSRLLSLCFRYYSVGGVCCIKTPKFSMLVYSIESRVHRIRARESIVSNTSMTLETLLRIVRDLSGAAQAEAQSPQNDEQIQAEARGANYAYETVALQIERMQDLAASDAPQNHFVDIEARLTAEEQAHRMRQNCLFLKDEYQACWDLIKARFPYMSDEKLSEADPILGFILTTAMALEAVLVEASPEDQVYTNQTLANLHNLLDAFKAGILSKDDGLIQ